MDLLKLIWNKLDKVRQVDRPKGIIAIIKHIEIAEKYYLKGLSEKNDHYFTDVVYRTNHAFEGILKEAYEVIEEKDASQTTPYNIEKYLAENVVFNERVMHLFSNYRKNWRNPSTHDYQLFFGAQEAFLSIVTVTSFVNILLDQIIEKLSFESSRKNVAKFLTEYKSGLKNYENEDILEKTTQILVCYSQFFITKFDEYSELPDAELLGSITGFISAFEPKWQIQTDLQIQRENKNLYVDIILTNENESLVIEIKRNITRYDLTLDLDDPYNERFKSILKASKVAKGIKLFAPTNPKHSIETITTKKITEVFSIDKSLIPDFLND